MLKRTRSTCSFNPKTDELEKLSGASSLVIGELAGAALVLVNNPDPPISLQLLASAPPAEPQKLNSTPRGSVSSNSFVAPKAISGMGANLICNTLKKPMQAPTTALPTAGIDNHLMCGSLIHDNDAPTTIAYRVAQSVAEQIASANSIALNVRRLTDSSRDTSGTTDASAIAKSGTINPIGGISLGNGYFATSGAFRTAINAHSDFNTSGNKLNARVDDQTIDSAQAEYWSGTATGTGSGSGSGTVTGSSSASASGSGTATGTSLSGSGGTYTIAGSGSGGLGSVQGQLSIVCTPQAGNYIGGAAQFSLSGGGPATISNVSWSSSGTPVMYSGQTIPNPILGGTSFVNTSYSISTQTGQSVNFYWGELAGVETVSASATLTIGGQSTTATATLRIEVSNPGWHGDVIYQKSASMANNRLTYGTSTMPKGIDWGGISPLSPGAFKLVQIIQGGTSSFTLSSPPTLKNGFKDLSGTAASFPLLDVLTGYSTPFYEGIGGSGDAPSVPANTNMTDATMHINFKDYVMYKPSGGIWVPEGNFIWTIDTAATKGANWAVTFTTATCTRPIPNHSSWPVWTDFANLYTHFA